MRWINDVFIYLLSPLVLAFIYRKIALSYPVIYCTLQHHGIHTLSEETSSSPPHLATCFGVKKIDGGRWAFSHVWDSRDDVPKAQRGGIIDVDGHILSGLWDGHGHLTAYGEMEVGVKAYGANLEKIIHSIKDYIKNDSSYGTRDKWIRGFGWDQALLGGEMPTAAQLSSDPALKDLFIMIDRVDGHCTWVSEAVLSLLPNPVPPTPPGGSIPSRGVFCDNAMDQMIVSKMPKTTQEQLLKRIETAMSALNKVGIVGVMDAALELEPGKTMRWMAAMKLSTLRVYGMLECKIRNTFCGDEMEKVESEDGMFALKAVKLFADGALGSYGAALLEPYDDNPETKGTMLISEDGLTEVVKQWYEAHWQICIHSIGDQANRASLNAFEAAIKAANETTNHDRRLRMEHAQIIHPDDLSRYSSLNIIPSIQPTHATSDMAYALSRLGSTRLSHSAYRQQTFFASSAYQSPILGSDFPIEPPNPIWGIYAATTRCDRVTGSSPHGKDGWYPEEKISRQQAIWGFTRNVAYGGWMEGRAGVIREGAWADWIVVDKDLWDEEVDLRDVVVRETWVAGRRVY